MSQAGSDSEPEAAELLINTRQRRSNAGNKLKALIEAQDSLEDEENIFMEIEGDEEFRESSSEEEESSVENSDRDNARDGGEDAAEEGDSDFFSSSDDSEADADDQEAEDAGEKALQKESREKRRVQQQRKRDRMLQLPKFSQPQKRVHYAEEEEEQPRKIPKKKSLASASLISEQRRSSSRTATIQNTQAVIERLQEEEKKQKRYVAPRRKQVQKMTQEEKMAEALITEQHNLASLNYYFEQEQLRKRKQREAMLAKRVVLKNVLRYVSSTKFYTPIRPLVEEVKENEPTEGTESVKDEQGEEKHDGDADSKSHANGGFSSVSPRASVTPGPEKASETPARGRSLSETPAPETPATAGSPFESPGPEEASELHNYGEYGAETVRESSRDPNDDGYGGSEDVETDKPLVASNADEASFLEGQTGEKSAETTVVDAERDTTQPDSVKSADDPDKNETEIKEEIEKAVEELDDEELEAELYAPKKHVIEIIDESPFRRTRRGKRIYEEHDDVMFGPLACRERNTLSLLNFPPDYYYTKMEVKKTLLGRQSLDAYPTLAKPSFCIVTGMPAKFRDPDTGLPYANMNAYKTIKRVKEGEYVWHHELGGFYASRREGQRHAAGVPAGFE